jgi:hypothetical protein
MRLLRCELGVVEGTSLPEIGEDLELLRPFRGRVALDEGAAGLVDQDAFLLGGAGRASDQVDEGADEGMSMVATCSKVETSTLNGGP